MTEQLQFTGTRSRLFDELDRGNMEDLRHLEVVEDYGEFGEDEDGNSLAYFQWDGGGRKLLRYQADQSLFLAQLSEIHGADGPEEERDWYQVESAQQAEWINRNLNGHRLTMDYQGPKIWTQEGSIYWRDRD